MKKITVFCGSSPGNKDIYRATTGLFAKALVKRGIDLVYGGATVGMMGAIADEMLLAGGKVYGVLPKFLQEKELAHQGLTELILVDSMHERKTRMNELCDGALALPGGFGTLEELFEMLTWAQLGLHQKPVAILNIDGFYDSLQALTTTMVNEGFLKPANRDMLLMDDDVDRLLGRMQDYKAPGTSKWLSPGNS
jgi:uncharacterized protein (TIGR00730 family)